MSKSAIIFMDYDNVWITCENNYKIDIFSMSFINKISEFIKRMDIQINEFISYGNYDNGKMNKDNHQTRLQSLGIQTRHCMNGKDSADIAIVCDLLEKLYLTSANNKVYILISCDKDIIPLINKIKSQDKEVIVITFAVAVDWDVMSNYGDEHFWFEEIIGIEFEEPKLKEKLNCDIFCDELKSLISKYSDVNYSLFSRQLQKTYNAFTGDVDIIKNTLISNKKIEFYEYEYEGRKYHDGIRFIKTAEKS